MNNLDIEATAKVIFFNPEISEDLINSINKTQIFVDKKIEEMISEYKTQLLAEVDNPDVFSMLEENITMLENMLNVLKESHL
jgi:hypothetical protein